MSENVELLEEQKQGIANMQKIFTKIQTYAMLML